MDQTQQQQQQQQQQHRQQQTPAHDAETAAHPLTLIATQVAQLIQQGRHDRAVDHALSYERACAQWSLSPAAPGAHVMTLLASLAAFDVPNAMLSLCRAQATKNQDVHAAVTPLVPLYQLLRDGQLDQLATEFAQAANAIAAPVPEALGPVVAEVSRTLVNQYLALIEDTYSTVRQASVPQVASHQDLLARGWTFDESLGLYTPSRRSRDIGGEPIKGPGLGNVEELGEFVVRLATL